MAVAGVLWTRRDTFERLDPWTPQWPKRDAVYYSFHTRSCT